MVSAFSSTFRNMRAKNKIRVKRFGNVVMVTLSLLLFLYSVGASTSYVVPSDECKTVSHAMIKTRPGDTILVDKGVYKEHVYVENGVVLHAKSLFEAIFDGAGREHVVTLGGNAHISGFEIRNGMIGVFSQGAGNSILKCKVVNNWGSGIICIGNLPKIMDNIIAYNKGSGIQGWKVRATSYPSISHNTIAFNANHGIAIGGPSDLGVENNIIAFNRQFAVKISQDAPAIRLFSNCFYANEGFVPLPKKNFSFDPQFVEPKKLNFTLSSHSPCKARSLKREDLGARIKYATHNL
ncbi:MAG: DUF1565 domain-containing protein [Chitinivibrionales bacterium]|nr:DUF1565 domain-containing protein [Chitinivibrionales bacterium]